MKKNGNCAESHSKRVSAYGTHKIIIHQNLSKITSSCLECSLDKLQRICFGYKGKQTDIGIG
jgi:hypothetical protein